MPNFERVLTAMEGPGRFLERAVGFGDTFLLAQVSGASVSSKTRQSKAPSRWRSWKRR